MEDNMIGTKTTRTNVLETLYKRGYVKGDPIEITELGLAVVNVLSQYNPEILSIDMTRHLENDMVDISKGDKTLSDMINQTEIVGRLKNFVKDKNLPHLLFVGPAGIGKTSSILALARDLFGPGYRNHILELNASDERGIDVIREKVKNFARTASISSEVML